MTDIGEAWSTPIQAQHTHDPCLASHGMVSSSESVQSSQRILSSTSSILEASKPNHNHNSNNSSITKQHKIMWTPEMENTALELYVRAVQDGKRSENGFVPDTHRSIARKLNDLFPNVDLDEKKVKSKYNQGFKRDYDTLKALRSACGFEWNDNICEVIASDEVWNQHLSSHPQARKFRNNPFPQSRQLELLFGPFGPSGSRVGGECMAITAMTTQTFGAIRNSENGFICKNDNSTGISEGTTPLSRARSRSRSPTRIRPHFITSTERILSDVPPPPPLLPLPPTGLDHQHRPRFFYELTKVEQAVDQLQEEFAHLLNEIELLKALSILESDTKAQVFLRLRTHDLRIRWLQQQFRNLREL
ncbi:hypothetical protein MJO28_013391 [Puccinia striiformis f. sp. tritici]|uniref:Uncharacterized protein n=1 Tax=Puccinia striiformis f. sp. tritici TaxID=168172 RepID=A0ACC0DYF9_9BASI|nr:hypothetical protein Pst134EA_024161 [Puccinia striiformis f. sp. tritici]KAH9453278.1 hypothetical protein Pst134EA_024161 [Puccinia striiformis f. sp. tritici]KAI7941106.1 hypothetical protein MJO28_013391 [Puccinia striiformis f. sp. tritici]KAI7942857.1 hypothetical protein MJO29_012701 [Puccinia striiformis f. sp. tritici]KAI9626658.1 hypothetical protein H4Q26_017756 [Puccinia striiformis f. sp. tritici PST-130]